MIEVARAVQSSATDLFEVAHTCDRCGKASKASVLATHRAWAFAGPYGVGESAALAEAHAGAARGLTREAERLVSLLRCPACGRRGLEHRRLWAVSLLGGLGAGAMLAMMVWPVSELFGLHPVVFGAIASVVIGVPIATGLVRRRCREAELVVEWVAPDGDALHEREMFSGATGT